MQSKNEDGFLQGDCPELGAVLKEIQQPHINSWAMTIASLVAALSFLLVLCAGDLKQAHHHTFAEREISTLGLSFAGVGFLVFGWACIFGDRCLRFHENGVSLLQSGKETKIPYSRLKQFDFKKTELYLSKNEQCYNINFDLEFKSNSAHSIKWNRTISGPKTPHFCSGSFDSTDYDWLNHHLSQIVADNIAAQIEMGHKIPWGKSSFIQKTGLEIQKKTGLLSAKMTFVPWSNLIDLQFRDGQLSLELGKPQSAQSWNATIQCDEANVLPGYLAIKTILESQAATPSIRYQSEAEISSAIANETISFTPWYGISS